jgi:hypothetical protein
MLLDTITILTISNSSTTVNNSIATHTNNKLATQVMMHTMARMGMRLILMLHLLTLTPMMLDALQLKLLLGAIPQLQMAQQLLTMRRGVLQQKQQPKETSPGCHHPLV